MCNAMPTAVSIPLTIADNCCKSFHHVLQFLMLTAITRLVDMNLMISSFTWLQLILLMAASRIKR